MLVAPLPDLKTLDAAALREMAVEQHAQISSRALEDLEARTAEERQQTETTLPPAAATVFAAAARKPARRPLPEHLPRESRRAHHSTRAVQRVVGS